MKRISKILFSLVSLFSGIILFFWLLDEVGLGGIQNTFLRLSGVEGSFLLLIGALYVLVGTLRWKEILKSKGHDFPIRELYEHYLASFAITYLVPTIVFGGEMFKGYVLNSRDKNPASLGNSMTVSFIEGIFDYAFEWLAIILGIIAFFFTIEIPLKGSYVLGLSILLFLTIIFIYYFLLKKRSLIRIFFKVSEDNQWRKIEKDVSAFFKIKNKSFQKAFLLSWVKMFLRFSQYWILVGFLGESIGFIAALSILGISVLAMAPPVSADLGTHDLGSAVLFERLGLGRETGIVFASVIRGMNLILSIFGIVFLMKIGIITLRKKILKGVDKINLISKFKK